MIALPALRDYQTEFVSRLKRELASHNRVIACMPTGAGKSTVAKYIFGSSRNREPHANQSGYSLIAVHRRGLVDNIVDTFDRSPSLPHGVVMSGRETNWKERVQVASIDTLLAWHVGDGYRSDTTFDLVAMDEAHSHNSKLAKWLEVHDAKRKELGLHPAFVIGLTATPQAKGLSSVYSKIAKGPTVQWLIDNGFLVPFRYFQAKHLGKLDVLKKQGNRFTDDSLREAFDGLAGDLVEDWKELAQGRPTVGFFSLLSHAREAQEKLLDAGVDAEYIDGSVSDEDRRKLFDGLQKGHYQYLCNVGIVDRGTDIPAIGCIQLCTAINSVTRLIQILGRGARPHESKSECICIDHGGSISRLRTFFEDDIPWTLEAENEKELNHEGRAVITCPRCGVQYRGGKCGSCDYEPSARERKSQGLEFVGGELVEIKKTKDGKKVKSCEEILIESLYRAGHSNRTWKQAIGIAKGAAEKQGTTFRVPNTFEVAGRQYQSVRYGDNDCGRYVSELFEGTFKPKWMRSKGHVSSGTET